MLHLFKHANRKWDIAFVTNEFIFGTPQGYEKRSDAINVGKLILKAVVVEAALITAKYIKFQDDTKKEPVIYILHEGKNRKPIATELKPHKKYIPKK